MQERSSTLKTELIDSAVDAVGVRCNRIAELKEQVEQGVYRVPGKVLADKLLHVTIQNLRATTPFVL